MEKTEKTFESAADAMIFGNEILCAGDEQSHSICDLICDPDFAIRLMRILLTRPRTFRRILGSDYHDLTTQSMEFEIRTESFARINQLKITKMTNAM
jgi:hypothetical protein